MPDQTALQTDITPVPGRTSVSARAIINEIKSFFVWWYVEIPVWYMGFFKRFAVVVDDSLSISLLIKTFLIPWHRDTSWMGYGFGIGIRLIYLPFALVLALIALGLMALITLFWALLPVITVISILRSPFI